MTTKRTLPISPNGVLWIAYLALLAVLLPHTSWAFSIVEPSGTEFWGAHPLGWALALTFESTIAAVTWKLQSYQGKRGKRHRWLNGYSAGLVLFAGISGLANWLHAEEFARISPVFAHYNLPSAVFSVLFGAALPVASLAFAAILAPDVSEDGEDPILVSAKAEAREVRRQLAEANKALVEANTQNTAMKEIALALFAPEIKVRIQAARAKWPTMPANGIAVLTGASAPYVSEVLSGKK